jgi:hypothetical protein
MQQRFDAAQLDRTTKAKAEAKLRLSYLQDDRGVVNAATTLPIYLDQTKS